MEEQWGFGNAKENKAFDTVKIGEETVDLFFGEHPHSRQDNTIYARTKGGSIYEFDGHRLPICDYLVHILLSKKQKYC